MEFSRRKNTTLSIITSGIRQISTVIFYFISQTVFIYVLGKEYLGLNGLFSNILQLLALSELGIGVAITFYLYKPLANDDKERVKALMHFYRKCYNVVGLVIFVVGCSIMPFLDMLVNFDQPLPENLYVIYLLFLLQSACTYFFFAYKQSLIIANQKLYIVERINIVFVILGCLVDVIVLLIFKSFLPYLIFRVGIVILKNLCISLKVDKEYPYIKDPSNSELTKDEIKSFFKDVYSVSIFKIGSVFFNSLSNFVISIMISTAVVGVVSNYVLITSQLQAIFAILITSVTASVGNVLAKDTIEHQYQIFVKLKTFCYVFSAIFTIAFFQLSNSFVNLWLGGLDKSYILSQTVVLFLSLDLYINTSCQIHNTFRQASGNFKIGRYLQFVGGFANLILAVILCKIFGLVGVFAAQLFSKLLITNIPFLHGVEKKLFGITFWQSVIVIIRDLGLLFICGGIVWIICSKLHETNIISFVLEIIVTLLVSGLFFVFVFRNSEAYKEIRSAVSNYSSKIRVLNK